MSQKLKIVLDRAGVKELLNSQECADICTDLAQQIAARAGTEYAVAEPHHTGQRVAVNVYPGSKKAAHDNYENHTLLRAIGR